MSESRKLFLNLPVGDLKRTMTFFSALGFEFNPKFTDEKAACMIIGNDAYAMLLTDSFFQTFTHRQICSPSQLEGLFAITASSRTEVDALYNKAIAAGGQTAMPAQDHGFMFARSFLDLDGHHWEVIWMDPKAAQ